MASDADRKSIARRDWSRVRDEWIAFSALTGPIHQPPQPGLSGLPGVEQIAQSISESSQNIVWSPYIGGLGENALHEAFFLAAKAAHLMRLCSDLAESGKPTWTLFNAYHGAYLSARSILTFLGILLPQAPKGQLLIDLFNFDAPRVVTRGKKYKLEYVATSVLDREVVVRRTGKLDQLVLWGYFDRILNVSEVGSWRPGTLKRLKEVAIPSLSSLRNPYLYAPSFWTTCMDLEQNDLQSFSDYRNASSSATYDLNGSAFLLLDVFFLIFGLLRSLTEDLAGVAPVFGSHCKLFKSEPWLTEGLMSEQYLEALESA